MAETSKGGGCSSPRAWRLAAVAVPVTRPSAAEASEGSLRWDMGSGEPRRSFTSSSYTALERSGEGERLCRRAARESRQAAGSACGPSARRGCATEHGVLGARGRADAQPQSRRRSTAGRAGGAASQRSGRRQPWGNPRAPGCLPSPAGGLEQRRGSQCEHAGLLRQSGLSHGALPRRVTWGRHSLGGRGRSRRGPTSRKQRRPTRVQAMDGCWAEYPHRPPSSPAVWARRTQLQLLAANPSSQKPPSFATFSRQAAGAAELHQAVQNM